MNKIETKHKIGDLVYIANRHEVDREVIKAIKITGVKESVSYGIKSKPSGGFYGLGLFGTSDGYVWYKTGEVFKHKEDAVNKHESLKAKYEADEAKAEAKRKAKREADLKEQLRKLQSGEDEECDDYCCCGECC